MSREQASARDHYPRSTGASLVSTADLRVAVGLGTDTSQDARLLRAINAAHDVASGILGFAAAVEPTCIAHFTLPCARVLCLPRGAESLTSVTLTESDFSTTDKAADWRLDPSRPDRLIYIGSDEATSLYADEAEDNDVAHALAITFPFAAWAPYDTEALERAVQNLAADIYGRLPDSAAPSDSALTRAEHALRQYGSFSGLGGRPRSSRA